MMVLLMNGETYDGVTAPYMYLQSIRLNGTADELSCLQVLIRSLLFRQLYNDLDHV